MHQEHPRPDSEEQRSKKAKRKKRPIIHVTHHTTSAGGGPVPSTSSAGSVAAPGPVPSTSGGGGGSATPSGQVNVVKTKRAFKNRHEFHKLKIEENTSDMYRALNIVRRKIQDLTRKVYEKYKALKFTVCLHPRFVRYDSNGEVEISAVPDLNSGMQIMLNISQFDELYDNVVSSISVQFDEWLTKGSGWEMDEVLDVDVSFWRYTPFGPTSYLPTPPALGGKHAIINVVNDDNACFKWALLSCIHADKITEPNRKRRSKQSVYEEFERVHPDACNLTGITFPPTENDFQIFEKLNKKYSLNIFQMEQDGRYPIPYRVSKHCYRRSQDICLLMIVGKESEHFCWMKNPDVVLKTSERNASTVCLNCCQVFYKRKQRRFEDHLADCLRNNPTAIKFPKKAKIKYSNTGLQVHQEVVAYCDIETINHKFESDSDSGVEDDPSEDRSSDEESSSNDDDDDEEDCYIPPTKKSKTTFKTEHLLTGYAIHVVSKRFQHQFQPIEYSGKDSEETGKHFIKSLETLKDQVQEIYRKEYCHEMNPLTKDEEEAYKNTDTCHICKEKITCKVSMEQWKQMRAENRITDDPKATNHYRAYVTPTTMLGPAVKDHDHFDGRYKVNLSDIFWFF